MPYLDWIKDRLATKQQPVAEKPQQQKPDYAKQMYAREHAQDIANAKPIEQLPESVRNQAITDAAPAIWRGDKTAPEQDNRKDAQESPTDANKVRAKSPMRGRVRGMER